MWQLSPAFMQLPGAADIITAAPKQELLSAEGIRQSSRLIVYIVIVIVIVIFIIIIVVVIVMIIIIVPIRGA